MPRDESQKHYSEASAQEMQRRERVQERMDYQDKVREAVSYIEMVDDQIGWLNLTYPDNPTDGPANLFPDWPGDKARLLAKLTELEEEMGADND